MEGLLATIVIDEYEDRKVGTFNVSGEYLQTDLPKDNIMLSLLEGKFVDIMCDITPEYNQNNRFKDGSKTLYVLILKAIYGMIESDLMCYWLYVSVLKDMGFQLNSYEMCVANKNMYRKYCTIDWYVDDNKV